MRQTALALTLAALAGTLAAGCQHQGYSRSSTLAEAPVPAPAESAAAIPDGAGQGPPPTVESAPLALSEDVFKPQPFASHAGEHYLAMTVNYPPIEALRKTLEAALPYPLKNRGEAHVTVLTPEEFKLLTTRVPAARIDQIAAAAQPSIQAAKFTAICVGHGTAELAGQTQHAWFVVLDSDDLVALRTALKAEFVKAGGDATAFDPDLFFPHVTLGFTERDLFAEDGVIKDPTSCVRPVATGA